MGGIAPRLSQALLPASGATIAENVELWSGEIRPIKSPLVVDVPINTCGVIRTLYSLQSTWLTWCKDVDVVSGFTPNDTTGRFYYTGDGEPKVSNYALATSSFPYPAQWYPLGVVNPTVQPLLTVNIVGTTPGIRSYVYTYVTSFEEESGPSPTSDFVNVGVGGSVTITNFGTPVSTNVDRIRIYRTLTGNMNTYFLFVAEIPITTTSYTDTIDDDKIFAGDQLNTIGWEPPPSGLVGLNASPNGFLSGFVGNVMYYSEPYQPHAWPPQYAKIFDYPIIGTAWYGGNQIVCTTGFTYQVSGVDPRSLSVYRFPDPYPCLSKKSIASSNGGIIYAAASGLIFAGSGGLQVLTADVLTNQTFAQYNPRTMRGAIQEGRYYGFYDYLVQTPLDQITGNMKGACIVFDYNDRASGVDQNDKLNTINLHADALFADPVTPLHYVHDGALYKFAAGDTYLTSTWRSKQIKFPYLTTLGAAKVFASKWYNGYTLTFNLYADGALKYSRTVNSNKPFRLPRFFKAIPYYLEIVGVADIEDLVVSTSIQGMSSE